MFTESLLDSCAPARRRWSTFLSFALQSVAIAALVGLPLFYTQALPAVVTLGRLIGPPPGEAPGVQADQRRSHHTSNSEIAGNTVRQPTQIRRGVAEVVDQAAAEPAPNLGFTVPGSTGSRQAGTQIMSLFTPPPAPVPPLPAPTRRIPVSGGVLQGMLIQQVRPVYPPPAIAARVQGAVVLSAVISRTGTIENLHVVSGHPLLVQAAVAAVRQWRYRPYLLNGEPVEVETQVTVNFTLGGG